jgi:hypothetical protein
MRIGLVVAGVVVAVGLASGCSGTKKALGLEKTAPDEFRVITKAPLVLPPDYALRPPRPGEARPGDVNASAEPRAAVFGEDIGAQATPAEKLFVAKANASAVDATIRTQVDFEGAALVRKSEDYADKLLAPSVTAPATTTEEESVRRATGGATPTIGTEAKTSKLPGL